MVISLDDCPGTVSLTSFHDITGFVIDLEGPLLPVLVIQRSDCDVLQRDDALGHVLCCVLEIVKTLVIQDKPPTLPAFPASALKWKMMVETFVISRSLVFYCIKVNRM